MLKKTITYQDLDGNPITEDFYFNLSKAEIAEMELGHDGGSLVAYLQQIVAKEDAGAILKAFKEIIGASIGRRSEDGRRFVKSEEITNEFLQTDAYSELFMELVTDADAAAKFTTGIVPADLSERLAKGEVLIDAELPEGEVKEDETPAYIRENREPTREEMAKMSKDELLEAFKRKNTSS